MNNKKCIIDIIDRNIINEDKYKSHINLNISIIDNK